MNSEKIEQCRSFIVSHFSIRSRDIPIRILRLLNKQFPENFDPDDPLFASFMEIMKDVSEAYGRRYGVRIETVDTKTFARLSGNGCSFRTYCGGEYMYDDCHRIVYLLKHRYESYVATLRDYVRAILKSRRIGCKSINDVQLFAFHKYPERYIVILNTYYYGNPFVPIADGSMAGWTKYPCKFFGYFPYFGNRNGNSHLLSSV